jgi:hypothetical protein
MNKKEIQYTANYNSNFFRTYKQIFEKITTYKFPLVSKMKSAIFFYLKSMDTYKSTYTYLKNEVK